MNPRERMRAVLAGRAVDRVPLYLEGISMHRVDQVDGTDDELLRAVRRRATSLMHCHVRIPSLVNRYLVTPGQLISTVGERTEGENTIRTSRIDTPAGALHAEVGVNEASRTSWHVSYPVNSLEDVRKMMSVKWEMPEGLEAPGTSYRHDADEDRAILTTHISSPFVCVAGMMPYQYFLELCITERALIGELTEICYQRIRAVLNELLSTRMIEYVWMGGCEWLTPPMGSPALYEDLVQAYEQPLIEMMHAAGAYSHVHCHGNVRSTLERVIARGADLCEPVEPPPDGDITFEEAKRLAGGRIVLGGNVEARVLEKGSVHEAREATRRAFDGRCDRMVLRNSAGPISGMTPGMHDNYMALLDVWEELSGLVLDSTGVPAEASAD